MNSGALGRHLHLPGLQTWHASSLHFLAFTNVLLPTSSSVTHLFAGLLPATANLTFLPFNLTTKIAKSMSGDKGQCFPKTPLLPGIIFLPPFCKTSSPSRLLPVPALNEIMHAGRLAHQVLSSFGLSSCCPKPSTVLRSYIPQNLLHLKAPNTHEQRQP